MNVLARRMTALALGLLSLSSLLAGAPQEDAAAVEGALARAGENQATLRESLERVPGEQRNSLEYLLVHMPDRDLRALSADFLLEEVRLAHAVRAEVRWGASIPEDVFREALLPYANVNERRDAWRGDFHDRFRPVVAECKTASEAAARLNQTIFGELNVRYSRERPKADQSPYESIAATTASCTGLSILLVDACRAVGVPARFVGTPLWSDGSGNHSWVEVWDDGWHFTGAAEPTGDALDAGWFTNRAAQARTDDPAHAIYAVSFRRTPLRFPTVWDEAIDYVYAVDVTERYTSRGAELPEGTARVHVRMVEREGGARVAARVLVTDPKDGTTLFDGVTKDERFDGNDHLAMALPVGRNLRLVAHWQDRILRRELEVTADTPLVTLEATGGTLLLAPRPIDIVSDITDAGDAEDGGRLRLALDRFFAASPEERASITFDPSLAQMLREHPDAVRAAAWESYRRTAPTTPWATDYAADRVTFEGYVSPYVVREVGTKPAGGWPLFIAMHGGGGVPKDFNDSQWRSMQRYYKDQPDLGGYLYLALRAPTDEWNGFYTWYALPLVENLIRQFLALGDVDPDRVFLMGYSHGGYGAFYLGPKLADRFAAVHASAAAPTDGHAPARNLRHLRFTYMVGEHDDAYGRRERCLAFAEHLETLRAAAGEAGAYPAALQLMEGRHHSDLPDRDKIRDMYDAVRDPLPRHLSWSLTDDRVDSFHWLHVPAPQGGGDVEAILDDNRLEITRKNVEALHVLLDERLIDFGPPVTVIMNGEESTHQLTPSLRVLCETLRERGDPRLAFTARVEL